MTYKTFPGKVYSVTSPNGCTVYDSEMRILAKILAETQQVFVATTESVTVTDDAAVLVATFHNAPVGFIGTGGVTAEDIEVVKSASLAATSASQEALAAASEAATAAAQLGDAALKSANNTYTGTNTFNGTLIANGSLQATAGIETETINGFRSSEWVLSDIYNSVASVTQLAKIFPDYKTQRIWRWPMENCSGSPLKNNTQLEYCIVSSWPALTNSYQFLEKCINLREIDINAENLTVLGNVVSSACPMLKKLSINAPQAPNIGNLLGNAAYMPELVELRLRLDSVAVFPSDAIYIYGTGLKKLHTLAISAEGCTEFALGRLTGAAQFPALVNLWLYLPNATKINLRNISTNISAASFTHLVRGLLTWDASSGTVQPQITLDLPSALQADADVVAAIAELETKGWTDFTARDGTIYDKINWV